MLSSNSSHDDAIFFSTRSAIIAPVSTSFL
jgi:hypothetical protein